jgi:hypothetical protein
MGATVSSRLSPTLTACAGARAAPPVLALKTLSANSFGASALRGMGGGTLRLGRRSMADLQAARALGADHLRFFIEAARGPGDARYRLAAEQWVALEKTLDDLQEAGLYMVLAAGFGDDARNRLWADAALQQAAIDLWSELAQRFRGRAVVAGFDIVNEPVPPGLTYAMRQTRWLDFAGRLVRTVQRADPTRVLIIQSAPDATPASFRNLRPLAFDNLVYSVHSYEPFDFTHQGVMREFPQPRPFPEEREDGVSTAQLLVDSLEPVREFAVRYSVPIYVGEFSAPRWAPGNSVARYLRQSIDIFERHGWSWAYHEYRAWHGWDAEMASGQQTPGPRSANAPAASVLRQAFRTRGGRG